MLRSLYVSNFAIIEDLTVEFNDNMTVLTGETGAGKSLIIDTISLLLGSRADSDMIRYGEKEASIIGVFTHSNVLDLVFSKYSIPIKDTITLQRNIYDTSKNVIKCNGVNITLSTLKLISSMLADIHVQNDTQKLFNPEMYLSFIDPHEDSKFDKLLNDYSVCLFKYNEELTTYNKILTGQKKSMERLDFLKYECEELEALDLYPNKDKELSDKIAVLSNFDKIKNNLSDALNELEGENSSAIDSLYNASKSLEVLSEYDETYQENSSKLLDFYYIATEIKDDISRRLRNLDYNEDELNMYEESLNEINKAKDKYKRSVDELIKYLADIKLEIDMALNYDDVLKEHKSSVITLHKALCEAAGKLTEYRKKLSKKLEGEIKKECIELDLENTNFNITFDSQSFDDPFDKTPFLSTGVDKVNFMISFNKGEPLKALYKVASGGEMSRIMLAFKAYLSKSSTVGLMVFDEIDTGVSGATAKKIAKKMHEISRNVQVLCITHLPQVAAIGDYHKHIYKKLINNRTTTHIEDLSKERRIEEVAMMLSGDKMSLYALEHAKSLLEEK